jgi:hypothetical protein
MDQPKEILLQEYQKELLYYENRVRTRTDVIIYLSFLKRLNTYSRIM